MSSVFKSIGKFVSTLFKGPVMPKMDIPAMPDPGSAAAKIAVTKKLQARKNAGREGTIYSGGAYGGLNLGGTS